MENVTFEDLISNQEIRSRFFTSINALIDYCKIYGFYEAAISHTKTRNKIEAELKMLD